MPESCAEMVIVNKRPDQSARATQRPRRWWHLMIRGLLFPLLVLFALLAIALMIVSLPILLVYAAILNVLIWIRWCANGRDVLFVSSESPHWCEHMNDVLLPVVRHRAIVLNWSERSRWPRRSLAVAAFRHFGGSREFNPMVIVFRPFRLARVFRFYQAFRDLKHSKADSLQRVESDLLACLGERKPAMAEGVE